MTMPNNRVILVVLSLFFGATSTAQILPASVTKKIDSIFKKWDNDYSPGYAVGIVRNDSLVFAKGYGMANLEYNIPITPETIFHMASVSKQFTAYSIVLLSRQGKLGLDDDIHKYLPWFPDLKEKITIRNLLNHTSGVRDQWQLLAIAGTRLDDVITQDQIVKVLSKQQALNFKPGEQYSYSNSGFTMLAEIVKSVTGRTLRQFTDSAIFKPLGMTNTHFHDDYTEIVKNRSYSYSRIDKTHFANSILSYSNAGATSLFTNVDDMSKWVMNFYDTKVGDQEDINLLTQHGKLTNGREIDYALGISVSDFNGQKMFSHSGGDAGYRTYVAVFPKLKMGFVVFSNLGDADPWNKAADIARLFIPNNSKPADKVSSVNVDSSGTVLRDSSRFRPFWGDYISDDGVRFSFEMKNQKLYWNTYGETYLLSKNKHDSFSMAVNPAVTFVFVTDQHNTRIVKESWPEGNRTLVKYNPVAPTTDKALSDYTGTYFCPELDCKYGIVLKDHRLFLTNDKYNDTPLTLAGPDHLFSDYWWMDHLQILRGEHDRIKGFEVNSGRVMHLWFKKIE